MYENQRLTSAGRGLRNPDSVIVNEIAAFLPGEALDAVLDYGAGNSPYKPYLNCQRYVTADITQNDAAGIDHVIRPGQPLDIADGTFDLVLLLDVLEHVPEPGFVIAEIRRLLKPGGRLIVSLPFLYREHETPHDFTRWTSFGAQALFATHGGETSRLRKAGNAAYTVLSVFLERAIANGEQGRYSLAGRVANRLAIALMAVCRGCFTRPPGDDAGTYHHLLLEVRFPVAMNRSPA